MSGAAVWCAYYRANPHRFAKDYLHLDLHLFQKILLVMMNVSTTFVFIASRGLGKTFLSAIFCCIRCILYPGTKICIASGTRGQSINVLEKIQTELRPCSPELCNEIDDKQMYDIVSDNPNFKTEFKWLPNAMLEWGRLIQKERDLITGVKKADRKRFKEKFKEYEDNSIPTN